MRNSRISPTRFLSLDSLVDIVSNNLGILIILSAFMALFALFNPLRLDETERRHSREQPPPRLLVPWSHPSAKNRILFVMRENRVQHIDLRRFYLDLTRRAPQMKPEPLTLDQEGLGIRFFPVTNQVYCLEFRPKGGFGESWMEAQRPGSDWRKAMERYRPEKFVYFFWVAGDSFELFRQVRQRLRERQYEVGWKPALKDAPLEVCSGFEGSTAFQPQ